MKNYIILFIKLRIGTHTHFPVQMLGARHQLEIQQYIGDWNILLGPMLASHLSISDKILLQNILLVIPKIYEVNKSLVIPIRRALTGKK